MRSVGEAKKNLTHLLTTKIAVLSGRSADLSRFEPAVRPDAKTLTRELPGCLPLTKGDVHDL